MNILHFELSKKKGKSWITKLNFKIKYNNLKEKK